MPITLELDHTPMASEPLFPKTYLNKIGSDLLDVSLAARPGESIVVIYHKNDDNMPLLETLRNLCAERMLSIIFYGRDIEADAINFPQLNPEATGENDTSLTQKNYFAIEGELIQQADAVIMIRGSENPNALAMNPNIPSDVKRNYRISYATYNENLRMNGKPATQNQPKYGQPRWVTFYWPTAFEANLVGMTQIKYAEAVRKAVDQDWEKIRIVQAKLVSILNQGKTLEIRATNKDSSGNERETHLTMSIEGQTFDNSIIEHNYPGSEVYSSPVMTSVNGVLFAPGKHVYKGLVIEDIYLEIENGEIQISSSYAKDDANTKRLREILSSGEGARYFGEIAFGTNPGLHVLLPNPLYAEKMAGTVHMAIGKCYENIIDPSDPTKIITIANENTPDRTDIHWDIVVSMLNGGEVRVDGKLIQKDGRFLDPELAILNPQLPNTDTVS